MIKRSFDTVRRLASDQDVRTLAGGSILTLVIKVCSAGLTYLMFVLFARVMTTQAFGEFSVGFNIGTLFAVFASLGAHVGITRWWPEYLGTERPALAQRVLYWGMKVTLAGSLAATGILALAGFGLTAFWDSEMSYLVFAALLVAPIAFAEYFGNALRAQGSVIASQVPKDLAWRIICCLVAIGCSWLLWPMTAWQGLALLSGVLAMLILFQFIYLYRRSGPPASLKAANRDEGEQVAVWKGTMRPLWGVAVLHAFVQCVDVPIVGIYLSPEAAGEYFAVVRTANLMGLMLVASTMICAPLISKYVHMGDIATLQRLLRVVSLIIAVPTVAAYALVVVLGKWLLGLFDPAFVTGYPALVVLGFGHTLNALCGAVGYTLMLSGHEGTYFRIMVISYAGVLLFQLIAIPTIGIIGAAFGSTIGMIVWNMWARHVAVRQVGIDSTVFCLFIRSKARRPAI